MNLAPRQVAGVWVQPVDMTLSPIPRNICQSCCMNHLSAVDCMGIDCMNVYFIPIEDPTMTPTLPATQACTAVPVTAPTTPTQACTAVPVTAPTTPTQRVTRTLDTLRRQERELADLAEVQQLLVNDAYSLGMMLPCGKTTDHVTLSLESQQTFRVREFFSTALCQVLQNRRTELLAEAMDLLRTEMAAQKKASVDDLLSLMVEFRP